MFDLISSSVCLFNLVYLIRSTDKISKMLELLLKYVDDVLVGAPPQLFVCSVQISEISVHTVDGR